MKSANPCILTINGGSSSGGNDYPAKEAGVVCVAVRGPQETKPVTAGIVACLGSL